MVFTSDMVNILPGYPKKSPDDPAITLLAFYLQLPQGSVDNVVSKDALIDIVKSDMLSIEGCVAGNISSVQFLTSASKEVNKDDESDEDSIPLTAIIIGASLGGVLLLVIIVLCWLGKRGKR